MMQNVAAEPQVMRIRVNDRAAALAFQTLALQAYWWLQTRAGQPWAMIGAAEAADAVSRLEELQQHLPDARVRLATAMEIESERPDGL